MMPQINTSTFILFDATVKTTILLALTAGCVLLAKHASASVRHILWTLGLACGLFLPLLSMSLPHWNKQVSASLPFRAIAIQPSNSDNGTTAPGMHSTQSNFSATNASDHGTTSPSNRVSRPASITMPVPIVRASVWPIASWPLIFLAIWISGFMLVLSRIIQGVAMAYKLKQSSQAIVSGPLYDVTLQAANHMPIGRKIEIRIADSISEVKVPITWGTRHPTIMLPAVASAWPADRVKAAILHEMAHVRRFDCLLHIAAGIVCAIYWFHPFVWLAARKMRQESETACDDLVVLAGIPAHDYARHLLDVAMSARNQGRIGLGAVAMAQTPKVEGRLRTVLAEGLARRPVTRRTVIGGLVLMLACALPLASFRLAAKDTESREPSSAVQRLSTGAVVKLIGITYASGEGKTAWNISGAAVPNPVQARSDGSISPIEQRWKSRQFIFQITGISAEADYLVTATASTSSISSIDNKVKGQTYLRFIPNFPSDAATGDIRMGVADGKWETAMTEYRAGGNLQGGSEGNGEYKISFLPPDTSGPRVSFTVNDTLEGKSRRIIALDNNGNRIAPSSASESTSGNLHKIHTTFDVSSIQDIKQVQFQTRPYKWVEFHNIPLQPRSGPASATFRTSPTAVSPDKSPKAAIIAAVEKDDLPAVKSLLAQHVNPRTWLGNNSIILDSAIATGDVAMVKLLVEAGAKIDDYDPVWHDGSLVSAAISEVPEITKILVENGARVNHKGSNNWTALTWAAINNHVEAMRILINHNADIDTRGSYNRTPLMMAAQRGKVEAMQLLLQRHARINLKDTDGKTALDYAREEAGGGITANASPTVKLLLAAGAR